MASNGMCEGRIPGMVEYMKDSQREAGIREKLGLSSMDNQNMLSSRYALTGEHWE